MDFIFSTLTTICVLGQFLINLSFMKENKKLKTEIELLNDYIIKLEKMPKPIEIETFQQPVQKYKTCMKLDTWILKVDTNYSEYIKEQLMHNLIMEIQDNVKFETKSVSPGFLEMTATINVVKAGEY